eukprot:scaffold351119_cov21-Prasinocladus_malaysianus.AAC.1
MEHALAQPVVVSRQCKCAGKLEGVVMTHLLTRRNLSSPPAKLAKIPTLRSSLACVPRPVTNDRNVIKDTACLFSTDLPGGAKISLVTLDIKRHGPDSNWNNSKPSICPRCRKKCSEKEPCGVEV